MYFCVADGRALPLPVSCAPSKITPQLLLFGHKTRIIKSNSNEKDVYL